MLLSRQEGFMNTKTREPDVIDLVDNLIRTIMSKSMLSPSSRLDRVDKRQSRYGPSSMGRRPSM